MNALLKETTPLLQHAVGKTVALELLLDPRLPLCRADRSQLQAATLNLIMNARDAMPAGGSLPISTAVSHLSQIDLVDNDEAHPGCYVTLAVRDTGHGMPPEILEHAIEPFFTTKELGKGTGLGLCQVHGFFRQIGGHVVLESALGGGTTVPLYFPVAEQAAAVREPAVAMMCQSPNFGLVRQGRW